MLKHRVVIHGVTGRMGQEVLKALSEASDMEPVGGTSRKPKNANFALPNGCGSIPISPDLSCLLASEVPQIVVDFSNVEACMRAATLTLSQGICFVTGTSGLKPDHLTCMDQLARENNVGVIVAPNFSLGAAILTVLAKKAAPYFEYVDIIESHHENKVDSPSGTSIAIAHAVSQSKEFVRNEPSIETLLSTRGGSYKGVGIHSLRQPGRSAHHEVVFGAQGQTLSLRHDTLTRDCYMPGVIEAIRTVVNLKSLVVGLERILDLE